MSQIALRPVHGPPGLGNGRRTMRRRVLRLRSQVKHFKILTRKIDELVCAVPNIEHNANDVLVPYIDSESTLLLEDAPIVYTDMSLHMVEVDESSLCFTLNESDIDVIDDLVTYTDSENVPLLEDAPIVYTEMSIHMVEVDESSSCFTLHESDVLDNCVTPRARDNGVNGTDANAPTKLDKPHGKGNMSCIVGLDLCNNSDVDVDKHTLPQVPAFPFTIQTNEPKSWADITFNEEDRARIDEAPDSSPGLLDDFSPMQMQTIVAIAETRANNALEATMDGMDALVQDMINRFAQNEVKDIISEEIHDVESHLMDGFNRFAQNELKDIILEEITNVESHIMDEIESQVTCMINAFEKKIDSKVTAKLERTIDAKVAPQTIEDRIVKRVLSTAMSALDEHLEKVVKKCIVDQSKDS